MAAPVVASSAGGGEDAVAEIYIRTIVKDGYIWFRLNITEEEEVLMEPNIAHRKSPHMSSMAAVGSTIYDIGGSSTVTSVHCEPAYADVYPVPLPDGRLLVVGGARGGHSSAVSASTAVPACSASSACTSVSIYPYS